MLDETLEFNSPVFVAGDNSLALTETNLYAGPLYSFQIDSLNIFAANLAKTGVPYKIVKYKNSEGAGRVALFHCSATYTAQRRYVVYG